MRGGVYTTNRRFQKMGHLRVGWLFLRTAMNYWNENYFLRDHKYWPTSRKAARALVLRLTSFVVATKNRIQPTS